MSTAPCDMEILVETLKLDKASLEQQLGLAIGDAKGWMTKFQIERDLAESANSITSSLRAQLDHVQALYLKAERRVETLLDVLLLLSKSKDND